MVSAKGSPSQGLTFRNVLRELPLNLHKPGILGENELLQAGLNFKEIATFIMVSLNGAAPLYAASQDPAVWRETLAQLHFYLNQLRKPQSEVTDP